MKTRWLLSGLVLGSLLALEGCGAGQYQIPNVEPVVKPKPEDDLLQNIEGNDKPSNSASSSATPSDTGGASGASDDPSGSTESSSKSKK